MPGRSVYTLKLFFINIFFLMKYLFNIKIIKLYIYIYVLFKKFSVNILGDKNYWMIFNSSSVKYKN